MLIHTAKEVVRIMNDIDLLKMIIARLDFAADMVADPNSKESLIGMIESTKHVTEVLIQRNES